MCDLLPDKMAARADSKLAGISGDKGGNREEDRSHSWQKKTWVLYDVSTNFFIIGKIYIFCHLYINERDKWKIYHSLNNARVWYNDTLIYRGTSMSTDKLKWKSLTLWFINSLLTIVNDEHFPMTSRLSLRLSICSTIKTIGGKTPPPWEFRFCLLKLQNTGSWREKVFGGDEETKGAVLALQNLNFWEL